MTVELNEVIEHTINQIETNPKYEKYNDEVKYELIAEIKTVYGKYPDAVEILCTNYLWLYMRKSLNE